MPLATLHEEWRGPVAIVQVNGQVDASNADLIGVRLRRTLTNHARGLVLDLRETTYLDSAGINVLFALGAEMRSRQQALRLVVAEDAPIARMLAITTLDRSFPAHATLEAAVEDAAAARGS
jgi:anti-sigma B factor antagonist